MPTGFSLYSVRRRVTRTAPWARAATGTDVRRRRVSTATVPPNGRALPTIPPSALLSASRHLLEHLHDGRDVLLPVAHPARGLADLADRREPRHRDLARGGLGQH